MANIYVTGRVTGGTGTVLDPYGHPEDANGLLSSGDIVLVDNNYSYDCVSGIAPGTDVIYKSANELDSWNDSDGAYITAGTATNIFSPTSNSKVIGFDIDGENNAERGINFSAGDICQVLSCVIVNCVNYGVFGDNNIVVDRCYFDNCGTATDIDNSGRIRHTQIDNCNTGIVVLTGGMIYDVVITSTSTGISISQGCTINSTTIYSTTIAVLSSGEYSVVTNTLIHTATTAFSSTADTLTVENSQYYNVTTLLSGALFSEINLEEAESDPLPNAGSGDFSTSQVGPVYNYEEIIGPEFEGLTTKIYQYAGVSPKCESTGGGGAIPLIKYFTGG